MDRRWLIISMIVFLIGASTGPVIAGGTSVTPHRTTVESPNDEMRTNQFIGASIDVSRLDAESAGVTAQETTEPDNITLTQRLKLTPSQPGSVSATLVVQIPDRVESLEVALPPGRTVTATDGFRSNGEDRFEWTGEGFEPTITYDFEANQTIRGQGPERGSGTYLYADVGDWALVAPQSPYVSYSRRGSAVSVDRRLVVPGEGVAGEAMAFLGPHETYTREANGQSFELIVPSTASMTASPERVLDTYANASKQLHVGERDAEVFTVAAPTSVDWAVRGLHYGDSDMWVRAVEPIETADNTWLHEYVHSRQRLNTTASSEWLIEASATYYAAKLALGADLVSFESFKRTLERGTSDRYEDVVLADQSTWTYGSQYEKGALIAGQLDRQIRLASDGAHQFDDVVAAVNARDGRFDHDTFLDIVTESSNASVSALADHYVTTASNPEPWTIEQHRVAFRTTPARFSYSLAPTGTNFSIESRYRNVSLDQLPSIAEGETLTIPVGITNDGGESGEYTVDLTVGGSVVAQASGRLAAGAKTTARLTHTFDQAGSYQIAVGDTTSTITVRPPETPTVTKLMANRSSIVGSGQIQVTATASATTTIPAAGTVTVTTNGQVVATQNVVLAPGDSREVQTTIELESPGEYEIEAGNQTTSVKVEAQTTTGSDVSTTDDRTRASATPTTSTMTDQLDSTDSTAQAGDPAPEEPTTTSGPGFTAGLAMLAIGLAAWRR